MSSLMPAGAVAATALVVLLVVGQGPQRPPRVPDAEPLSDLEILPGEEDLQMLDEGIEVYGGLEGEPECARGRGGVPAASAC